MRRPLAILLTLLLAAACLPLVVFAAPAEVEAPEVPDEVKGVHVHHLMVTMEDDPETTFPLDLTIYPEQESDIPYEEDSQDLCYWIDLEGNTWLVDLENDPAESQALPEDVSPNQVNATHEHNMVNYKPTGYFYTADNATTCLKITIWTRKCTVAGCTYTDTITGESQAMSHRYGAEKITSADHSSSIYTKHTVTYSKECSNCHYISSRKVNAGCTAGSCNGQIVSIPPEEF